VAEAKHISTNYSAVSLLPESQDCCEAVKEIVGIRFLSHEAPLFPLNECDRSERCKCKYKHWQDRRQDNRRNLDMGIANQFFHEDEKRTPRSGRRNTD
jgi:hypothetical protein